MSRWLPVGALVGLLMAESCALETSGRGNIVPTPDGGCASGSGDSGTDCSDGSSSLSPLSHSTATGWGGAAGAAGALGLEDEATSYEYY